jgi:hypothetical protein
MKKKYIIFIATVLLLCAATTAFGQKKATARASGTGNSAAKIEKELVRHVENLKAWSAYKEGYDQARDKKREAENEAMKAALLKYGRLSSTLKYPFPELSKLIYISTSKDNKFRIYSWDSESGGTMHFFDTVYQFQARSGKVFSKSAAKEKTDAGFFSSDIFTVDTGKDKVYLARLNSIYSNPISYQSVNAYSLQNNILNEKVKLIRTASGLTNKLGFQYNFFSVVDRKERPIKLISYDDAAQTIKIPVVIADKKDPIGRVTNKFIVYKFNGKYFVKVS